MLKFATEKLVELADLIGLWLQLRPLKKFPKTEGTRTCLIMSNSVWRYQIRTEGMLGLALKRQGWKLIVLTSRRFWPEIRQFWCHDMKDFIFVEDLYQKTGSEDARLL